MRRSKLRCGLWKTWHARHLLRNHLTVDDLDLYVPHQANVRIIKAVAERLGLPFGKIVLNMDRYGNTSAASIPIALDEAVRDGRVTDGRLSCLVRSERD